MSTIVFNPSVDASPYGYTGLGCSWGAIHNGSGTHIQEGTASNQVLLQAHVDTNEWQQLQRFGMIFDTSTFGAGYEAVAAALTLTLSANPDSDFSGRLALVEFSPASDLAIVISDFANFGVNPETPKLSDDLPLLSEQVEDEEVTLTLNAVGLAALNLTGYTKLGIILEYDLTDTAPPWAASNKDSISFYASESATGKPSLSVTAAIAVAVSDGIEFGDGVIAIEVVTSSDGIEFGDSVSPSVSCIESVTDGLVLGDVFIGVETLLTLQDVIDAGNETYAPSRAMPTRVQGNIPEELWRILDHFSLISTRTSYTLEDLTDVESAPREALIAWCQEMNLPVPDWGTTAQIRELVRQAVYINKYRSSEEGWETYLNIFTDATISVDITFDRYNGRIFFLNERGHGFPGARELKSELSSYPISARVFSPDVFDIDIIVLINVQSGTLDPAFSEFVRFSSKYFIPMHHGTLDLSVSVVT